MKFISIIVLTISILSNLHAGDKTYKVKTDSKGVKTFYNKKPADPNFKIELKKIGEISPDYLDTLGVNGIAVYDYDFDAKGDITILDHNRMWKFNKNGRFINKWSRNGYGPGEFQVPFNFFMLNDTIYVSNSVSRKIIKFDNDGKFINDIHIENSLNYPKDIICAYDKYLLGYSTRYSYEKERNIDRIVMFDSKTFEIKKSLFEKEYKKLRSDWTANVNVFIYAGDEKVFFVVDNSFNDYKINCYDSKTGKLKYKIRKNHIKVKNNDEVKDHYGVYDGKTVKIQSGTSKFKESINQIFYDSYDRLWVNSNNRDTKEEEGCMYFDIFKDGIFINRIKLKLYYSNIYGFKLNGNKIVQYARGSYIDIYEFK